MAIEAKKSNVPLQITEYIKPGKWLSFFEYVYIYIRKKMQNNFSNNSKYKYIMIKGSVCLAKAENVVNSTISSINFSI